MFNNIQNTVYRFIQDTTYNILFTPREKYITQQENINENIYDNFYEYMNNEIEIINKNINNEINENINENINNEIDTTERTITIFGKKLSEKKLQNLSDREKNDFFKSIVPSCNNYSTTIPEFKEKYNQLAQYYIKKNDNFAISLRDYKQENLDLYKKIIPLSVGSFNRIEIRISVIFLKRLKELNQNFLNDEFLLSLLSYRYSFYRPDKTIDYLHILTEKFPKKEYWGLLGHTYLQIGNLREAEKSFQTGYQLCPTNNGLTKEHMNYLYNIFKVGYYTNKSKELIENIKEMKLVYKLINNDPCTIPDFSYQLTNFSTLDLSNIIEKILLDGGEYREAKKLFLFQQNNFREINKDDNEIEYLYNLFKVIEKYGSKHFNENEVENEKVWIAENYYEMINRIKQNLMSNTEVHRCISLSRLLAKCQRAIGNFQDSIELYEKLKDEHELAKTYYEMGNYKKAYIIMKKQNKSQIEQWITWQKIEHKIKEHFMTKNKCHDIFFSCKH